MALCGPAQFFHTKLGENHFFFTDLDFCTEALSCWKRKEHSPNCHKFGSTLLSKISLDAVALRVPLIGSKGPWITDQNYTLVSVRTCNFFDMTSLILLISNILLLQAIYCMLSSTHCHIQFTAKAVQPRKEWMPALDGDMKEMKDSKRVINRLIMWKVPAASLASLN